MSFLQWGAETTGASTTGTTTGFGAPTSTDWGADASDWAASSTTTTTTTTAGADVSTDWGAPSAGGENWA